MAENIKRIADRLGAEIVGEAPDAGVGLLRGTPLRACRNPPCPAGARPGIAGRATHRCNWERHPKVPMSRETERRLVHLAERVSNGRRKVSPMQLAAQILEDALSEIPE